MLWINQAFEANSHTFDKEVLYELLEVVSVQRDKEVCDMVQWTVRYCISFELGVLCFLTKDEVRAIARNSGLSIDARKILLLRL